MNLFLLKSAGVIALFYIVYKIFLEHDTYFKGIRLFFIAGMVLSFIIPFISITKYVESPQTQQFIYSQNFQNFVSTNTEAPFNWAVFLFSIYVIGVVLSGLYLIFQITNLIKLLNTKPVKEFKSYKIIETQKDVSPFSFFKYIVYNPAQFSKEEIQQLLKHEETHVFQKHSIDMLLAQLLVCVQWFNPFAWWYKKIINQNLEYIADKEAKSIITPKNYSYLLLKTTTPNYQVVLANNFYNSLLKKRIMMLHKNHSHSLKQLKLALILPLLMGFIFIFNTKVVAQHKDMVKIHKKNITVFAITLDKDFTTEDVNSIKSTFKDDYGFQIKIRNVKRNAKNEVTGIKIVASKGKYSTEYAVKGNSPIEPIRFMYNSKNNQVKIESIAKNHFGNYYTYDYKGKGKPQKFKSLKYSLKHDDNDGYKEIYFFGDKDSIHKLKGKNSFVFISNKDKDKSNASLFTKQRGNVSATWIDDDGNKTDIIEVKEDGNVSKIIEIKTDKNGVISKTVRVDTDKKILKDKNGNITKTVEVKSDKKGHKFIVKEVNENDDINASEFNDKFPFSFVDGGIPLFVIDGKILKEGIPKSLNPNNIKSITVLKGEKAINKYGRKGKNGVIEITLKKKAKK